MTLMSDPATRLLTLLNVPENPDPDWPKVCHSLSEIQPCLHAIVGQSDDIGWVAEGVSAVVAQAEPEDLPLLGQGPRRGIITDHPVFAALAAQPSAGSDADVARKLQAIFLASVAVREVYVVNRSYRSPVSSAGRSCRRVAQGQHSDPRIDAVILDSSTPDALCGALESLLDHEQPLHGKYDRKVIDGLLPLLRDVRDDRSPRSRKPGARRRSGSRTTMDPVAASDGPGDRVYRHRLIVDSMDEGSRAQMRSEGLAAVHETTRQTLYVAPPSSRNPNISADYLTEDQANQRLILRARSFKTAQQPVPNHRSTLHSPALALLLNPVSRRESSDQANRSWVADVQLGFMLLTGCTVADLPEVRLWATRESVPATPPGLGIILASEELVVPAARLPESWQPDSSNRHHFRSVEHRFFLPLPRYLPVVRHLLDFAALQESGYLLPPTVDDRIDQVSAELNARISHLNELHHTRMTADRISRFVWSATYALDGDIAEALLLSYRHRQTNDPRLYYYAVTGEHLAAQYSRIWRRAAHQIGLEAPTPENDRQPPKSRVGSAAVPTLQSLRSAVAAMKEHAVAVVATRGRRSVEDWMEVHNVLTAYVVRQIQWMTGIRAVRDPIELDHFVRGSGFLGVIDKDSKDEYGARVVWLVEPVQRQIQAYLHRVELATRSIFGSPKFDAAFRFISEQGSLQHADQQILVKYGPDYPYAPNSHRHYMRTRLRELGVDGGVVDAWMGHGGIGREPYARHSAISPAVMRDAVAPALGRIWDELGWEVLPGREK